MGRSIQDVKRERGDLSTFMVHLTKDIKKNNGNTISAKDNLMSILNMTKIEARNPKGMCYNWPKLEKMRNCMHAVCFTETPVEYLKYLFDIDGRDVNLEPYGIIFTKNLLQERGANPVFYINTYASEQSLKKAICRLINELEEKKMMDNINAILPFLDIFGKSSEGKLYDFYWEREWRYQGDFSFNATDVVLGLCKEEDFSDFKEKFPDIKFISPYMSLDEIIQRMLPERANAG